MKKNPENLRSSASQKGFTPLKKSSGEVSGGIKLFRTPFQRNLFRKSSSLTGFTLLEVMVAMVILSIGLLGMASLTASIIRNNVFSDDFTTATALAQDKLEAIANSTWDSTTTIASGHILFDSNSSNNTSALLLSTAATDSQMEVNENGVEGVVGTGYFFTRTWNIWDRVDIVNPATRKDVGVIVTWTSDYGTTKTITMTTIKTQT